MKAVLTRKELAERWSVDVKTIANWESDGIIQRIEGIPMPRYSLELIQKIEGIYEFNALSPLERNRLEHEIRMLSEENKRLKAALNTIFMECYKIINIKNL